MKAKCPTQCGREVSTANGTVCDPCWGQLPGQMRHDIVTAWAVYRNSRSVNMKAAALRKHRQAKTFAIQHLTDKHNKEKVLA